ncbi:unnamed protein product [Rangifer tarandus platyrhynchus]|uniref:Uncharacterized protein n=2 Tax=Rangifer tarandus platyrhynchus TaxID=3082113 RepID=A0ACB0DXS6_RANTA|nr:unnamed protein product [Rangifer tarandus platyrhynchus]CAI9693046.1 unnamed protein product [Rangifer tarandus platyrhynchus]
MPEIMREMLRRGHRISEVREAGLREEGKRSTKSAPNTDPQLPRPAAGLQACRRSTQVRARAGERARVVRGDGKAELPVALVLPSRALSHTFTCTDLKVQFHQRLRLQEKGSEFIGSNMSQESDKCGRTGAFRNEGDRFDARVCATVGREGARATYGVTPAPGRPPPPRRPGRRALEATTSGVASGTARVRLASPGDCRLKRRGARLPGPPKASRGARPPRPGRELETRRGKAAGAAGRRAWVQSRPGSLPAGLAPASGPALCRLGEVGPRAGARGSRRWVPRPFLGFGGDTPFPLLSGASPAGNGLRPIGVRRATFPPCPVALSRRCGHSKETFLRALLLARWPWTFSD